MSSQNKELLLERLIEHLDQITVFMRIADENEFKIRAYEKAARSLETTAEDLAQIASGDVKLAGVGEGIRKTLQEFLKSGTSEYYQELFKKTPSAVLELMKIPGLGPKKAALIHHELGIQSVGELEYACRENRLLTLKGFGEKVQEKVLKSIEAMRTNSAKWRLDQAWEIFEELKNQLKSEVYAVGELGRHCEIVSCLELWGVGASFEKEVIKTLKVLEAKETSRTEVTFKTPKNSLTCVEAEKEGGQKIKLWISSEYSKELNYYLCAAETLKKEIQKNFSKFEPLETAWLQDDCDLKPKAAVYRISKNGKMRGFFHCHTDFSDGRATLEGMIQAAQDAGYEYIGISDHSQSAFYAHGLKEEHVLEQRSQIQKLQKKFKIKVFHGIESDILADGKLDYGSDVLAAFDFVIGSIHSRFQMDEEKMTARLVNALSQPATTMWGHPTGRLILGRKGYDLDWKKCLKTAKQNDVAVEINANPHRLDLDWRIGAQIEEFQVQVCVNPDAHTIEGIQDTMYGEWMAEKAQISSSLILNLLSVDEIQEYLWKRKKQYLKVS